MRCPNCGASLHLRIFDQKKPGSLFASAICTSFGWQFTTKKRVDLPPAWGELWKDQGLVFTTHAGGPLSARNVLRDFQAVLSRAGMRRGTIHSLRHGCASLLAASGASLKEAQEILGHSSYQLTANLYTHVFEKAKRDAMDRMDAYMALP